MYISNLLIDWCLTPTLAIFQLYHDHSAITASYTDTVSEP